MLLFLGFKKYILLRSKQFHSLNLCFKVRTKHLTAWGNSFLLFTGDAQSRSCCQDLIFKIKVVGQLSILVTCIFAIQALRTQVGKVWWETRSPARLFTADALRLEGMVRFIGPNNFPSFFKRFLLQLLTISFWKWHVSGHTKGHKKGESSIGKLIQDPQLTPSWAVPLAMGHSSTVWIQWAEPGADLAVPGSRGRELGASRWQTAAYIQAVHPGGSYPQHLKHIQEARPESELEAGTSVCDTAPARPAQGQ